MAFLSPFILSWRGLTGSRTRDERLIAHEDPLCLVVLLCKPVALLACNMAAEHVSMPIYEYACHEGNHGLAGILAGWRRYEAEGMNGDGTPKDAGSP